MDNKPLFVEPPYRKRCVIKNLDWMFYQVKAFFQRGKNGYSDYDLVDFDCYLGHILAHGLHDFIENTCTTPHGFTDDEWHDYVAEMAQHFYNSMEANKDEVMPNKYHKYFVMCSAKHRFKHPVLQKFWEEERRIVTWQDEEKKKGLEMLTKVFDDLWN